MNDPQTALTLFNAIASAGRTLYDIAQGTSKLETKQQLMEVYDTLMGLKRQVAELEDENHGLKQKLRFKSDDFEFKSPFWFETKHPDRPLCAKCFAEEKIGPMGEPYRASGVFRTCLVCNNSVRIEKPPNLGEGPGPGSLGWMGT